MDSHLVLLLVLHEEVLELIFIDLDHVIFALSFVHDLSIDNLVVHHLVVVLNLLLHALNSVIFFLILLLAIIFVVFLFHAVLVNLVHVFLLLLESLRDGGLLLWVELIEVLDVVCLQDLLGLLLVQLHLLVVGVFVTLFVLLVTLINLIVLIMINIFLVFFVAFHLVLLVDLALGALHLDLVDDLHLLAFVAAIHLWTAFLHQGLPAVLGWEVRRRHIQSVVVLCRDQELALLVSEMLIWVVAGFAEKRHEVL